MADFVVERCDSCLEQIIWAETERGKAMPVDAEPSKDGNVQLDDRTHLELKPLARVLSTAKCFGKTQLRKSHFATCAHANMWRRDKRRAAA